MRLGQIVLATLRGSVLGSQCHCCEVCASCCFSILCKYLSAHQEEMLISMPLGSLNHRCHITRLLHFGRVKPVHSYLSLRSLLCKDNIFENCSGLSELLLRQRKLVPIAIEFQLVFVNQQPEL